VTITKRELVIRVANRLGMTQSDVARVIEGTFEAISGSLAEGKRWELRDFGVFEVKTRASRIGRNPRTGDQVPVPARRVVTFRPGKKMKEVVAGDAEFKRPAAPKTQPPPAAPPQQQQQPPAPAPPAESPPPQDTPEPPRF
jgi:nucleoid DNA-binding protein